MRRHLRSPAARHPPLQRIIRRCLAKDPRERYQHAGEVRSALEAVQAGATNLQASAALPTGRSSRWLLATGASLLVITAVLLAWMQVRTGGPPVAIGASGRPTVAVMSFVDRTGAAESAWLSQGAPSMLLTGLTQRPGIDIVSPQRLREVVRQIGGEALETLDERQVAEVARRAGAGAIVVGHIFKSGAELRIDVQLEDLSTGRILTADTARGTDVFSMTDQLASGNPRPGP